MKTLKCLIVFSFGIFLFSCTSESDDIQRTLDEQEINTRNMNCTSPEPVTYSVSGSKITINSIVDQNVNLIAIHKASNYAYVETLCDYWTGGDPDCGPNLTSGTLADDDYLLKVSTNTGYCWIEFTTPSTPPASLVTLTSSGGTISVSAIDASVTRVDIHNVDYTIATPVSSICNPWSTVCNAPISTPGFTTGNRLLRIEQSGTVTWKTITIN